MIKVMTIVGTRPEVIKMSRVIAEFDRHTKHVLVHTGQNYDFGLNQVFFDDLDIRRPDYYLEAVGETTAETIGLIIQKSDRVFELEKPDAVLIYGDTNSGLSVLSAKRRKIPIFHMEAGNRCFDKRVPEELNRKVIDHLSDINLVLTEHARRYLIAEGIKPETVIKTGSHMPEVIKYYMLKIQRSSVLDILHLSANKYFLVSAHREENVDDPSNLFKFLQTLNKLSEVYGYPVIVSTHPRTQKRLALIDSSGRHPNIRFLDPFGFCDYLKLQMNAFCVISDSGTITEEASLLDIPAITIRNTHERPEGMDAGVLIMSGLKSDRVIDAVNIITSQRRDKTRAVNTVPDYTETLVSQKILRIVMSYTDYVNRTVWMLPETNP